MGLWSVPCNFVKFLVLKKEFDFDTQSMIGIRKAMKIELEKGKLIIFNEDNVHGAHQSTIEEEDMESYTNSDFLDVPSQGLGLLPMPINRDTQTKTNQVTTNVQNVVTSSQYFTFNNFGVDTVFETNGTETRCLGCLKWFQRIIGHLQNSTKCKEIVDFVNFSNAFADLKKDIKTKNEGQQRVQKQS